MIGSRPALAVSLIGDAARVGVGVLWILEAVLKYSAGFGAADILLVAGSTAGNSRAPFYLAPLSETMRALPGLFGVGIPLLELVLGILLIAGLATRTAAFVSIATLMLYWSSDQLIAQYPIMVGLSAIVLVLAPGVISVDAVRRRHAGPHRRNPDEE